MSETTTPLSAHISDAPAKPARVTLGEIFWAFLVIGAVSFGGGLIVYLRNSLVSRRRWVDESTFVEMISISQSLPGSYAVNVGVFLGDRLRGAAGAIAGSCRSVFAGRSVHVRGGHVVRCARGTR